jgi:phosphate-selective porin OprO/OprP
MKNCFAKSAPLGALVGVVALGLSATSGFAQDSNTTVRSQIDILKQQMSQMQQQIENLQRQELRAEEKANAAAQAAANAVAHVPPPNAPRVTESATHEFGLSSADGRNTINLTGVLDLDAGTYFGYSPDKSTVDRRLASGINARRARIGVTGLFEGDWVYRLVYDFGGNSDSLNFTNAGANGNKLSAPALGNTALSGIENAFITYNGFYTGHAIPIAFDFGIMDVPWTLDEPTGANNIMFLERSSSQVVATEFGGGDSRTAFGARSNNDRYWVGAYITGPQAGAFHTDEALTCTTSVSTCTPTLGQGPQLSFLARGSYQIIQNQDGSLHLGVDVGDLFRPRGTNNASTITLSDRPELRIDPTVFLATPAVAASGGTVIAAEAAAAWHNAFLQGEYYHYSLDGIGPTPDFNFNGGYVQASYSFGGKRFYSPATGAYTGVIPEHPLSFATGGWGALELAARYSVVDLNDGPAGLTCPSSGTITAVCGGDQTVYSIGVNYYPNLNMRFMLDYEHANVDIPSKIGGPSTKGASFDAVAARTQINF